MVVHNKLSLILTFDPDGVRREFEPSYKDTIFGQSIKDIFKDKKEFAKLLARAFAEIHGIDPSGLINLLASHLVKEKERDKMFQKQRVRWYLSKFFTTLRAAAQSGDYSTYLIRIKACKERYFYALEAKEKNGKQSKLIHEPFFQKATPPQTVEEEDKVRGVADTVLFLAPEMRRDVGDLTDLISWFDIKLECRVSKVDNSRNSLTLIVNPEIDRSKYISLPPRKHDIILVSSPNVRNAVADLSEVWLNPTAKSVLLSAATGSGKEVLVNLLTDAMMIDREERINLSAPAIEKFEELRKILVKRIAKRIDKKDSKEIFKQERRTILFLDEIHHDAAQDLRSGLLRLMELNELRKNTGEIVKISPILYLFAVSLPPEELWTQIKPQDLWTRIEYTVKLSHPLLIEDDDERKNTLKDYFLLFWCNHTRDWEKSVQHGQRHDWVKPILNDTIHGIKTFLENREDDGKSLADELSERFVSELGSPLIPLISIRELRNIVKRLFSRTVNYLYMSPQFRSSKKESKKIRKYILNVFRKWIVEIFNELVPEIGSRRGLF